MPKNRTRVILVTSAYPDDLDALQVMIPQNIVEFMTDDVPKNWALGGRPPQMSDLTISVAIAETSVVMPGWRPGD
jgi:hypothetical protein